MKRILAAVSLTALLLASFSCTPEQMAALQDAQKLVDQYDGLKDEIESLKNQMSQLNQDVSNLQTIVSEL